MKSPLTPNQFLALCRSVRIIPVLVVSDLTAAVEASKILISQGFSVIEITLRTDSAWEAAETIAQQLPDATVGVGSVLQPSDLVKARELGLHFAVSPGHTRELLATARLLDLPYLPGVATLSEVMNVRAQGFHLMKLFPAELNQGTALIRAISAPVQDVLFCPTGGVTPDNLPDYLECQAVACVGGTWLATKRDLETRAYDAIHKKAVQAAALAGLRQEMAAGPAMER